jgi:hypothetical protein
MTTLDMTRLELIARDLAAVLSPEGEGDWRRFTGMAEDVGTRLHTQLAVAFPATKSRSQGVAGH